MGWDSYDRQMSVFTREVFDEFFTLSAKSIKLTGMQKTRHKKTYMIIKPEILAEVRDGIKTYGS